jgi:hypothetical protein
MTPTRSFGVFAPVGYSSRRRQASGGTAPWPNRVDLMNLGDLNVRHLGVSAVAFPASVSSIIPSPLPAVRCTLGSAFGRPDHGGARAGAGDHPSGPSWWQATAAVW